MLYYIIISVCRQAGSRNNHASYHAMKKLLPPLLLLFFTFSFLFRTDHAFDQDLGRHLKLGEIILQSRTIPKINLFSYTSPDFPFINTHWLFEVFIYLTGQTIGLQTVLILKIIIFLFSVWLIIRIVPKENQALLLPVGFIFLHVLRERLELRPEIFSFLFTVSTYYILEKNLKKPTKLIYLLPAIQLVWINTHIYFFAGLILQAIFLVHLIFKNQRFHPWGGSTKLLSVILLLSVLLSLINPNGLAGLLYPLNVTKNYGYTIVENQTMFLLENIQFRDPNFLFVKLSWAILGLSIIWALIKKKFEVKNILLALFGLGLTLLNVRSFPYLVFISLPAVLMNFPNLQFKGVVKFLSVVTCALLLFESFFYLNGDYYKYRNDQNRVSLELIESSKEAMDYVLGNNLPQPIFNNFDIGSYIIYRGYPQYKVFVDGRPEAYSAKFFQDVYIPMQSDYAKFKEAEKTYGFKTIIFSHTDQTPWGRNFLQNVVKDPQWKIVYIDDFMIALTSAEIIEQKKLTTIELAKLNPAAYQFGNSLSYLRLGIFLLGTQNMESGRLFVEKTLQLFPDDPIANSLFGKN